jgi:N-acetylneuraminic acid mutarotase
MLKNRKKISFVMLLFILIFFIKPIFSTTVESSGAGSWTTMSPMPTPRGNHGIAVHNEKIYVFGGVRYSEDLKSIVLPTVEIFDPEKNIWSTGTSMRIPRLSMGITSYNDKIYIFGGDLGGAHVDQTDKVEIYDPLTDSWSSGAPMPTARSGLVAVLVDDLIYAIGGMYKDDDQKYEKYINLGIVEIYDPISNSWSSGPSMPTPKTIPGVVVIDNNIFIIGGHHCSYLMGHKYFEIVEVLDTKNNTWTTKEPMPVGCAATNSLLLNDAIYVFELYPFENENSENILIYDVNSDVWTIDGEIPNIRWASGAAEVNNKGYIIGGRNCHVGSSPICDVNITEEFTPPEKVYEPVIKDEDNDNVNITDSETPGFEILSILFVIVLVLIWKHRKKN